MRKVIITLIAAAAMAAPLASAESASAQTGPQHQAVAQAKDYLQIMAFSRLGLAGQLQYDGFSHTLSLYGANHSGANWNTQAVRQGKGYLRIMHFSCSGLIGQLRYDKFTPPQASYGAHHTSAC